MRAVQPRGPVVGLEFDQEANGSRILLEHPGQAQSCCYNLGDEHRAVMASDQVRALMFQSGLKLVVREQIARPGCHHDPPG